LISVAVGGYQAVKALDQYSVPEDKEVPMKRVIPLMIGLLLSLAAFAVEEAMPANPPAAGTMNCPMGQMTPEMRQHMMSMLQGLMTMAQNTAVWTPQGLYVLQGNRVLQYDTNLALRRQAVLPLPPTATATMPPAGGTAAMPMVDLSSLVPAKLVPTDNGIIVVRGQQILRLDNMLRVVNVAALPVLPPMTPQETAAVCPLCQQMAQMMAMGMMGMPSGTGVAAAPPATGAMPGM